MSRRCASPLILLALLGSASCEPRAAKGSRGRSDAISSASSEMSGPSLFSSETLTPALLALGAKTEGKWLRLEIRAREIVLQAEDPRSRGAVVEYHYRDGTVSEPEQARLRGKGQLTDNLFDSSEVKLAAIPELTREAVRRIDAENGTVELVLVRRDLPERDELRLRVYVSSPRQGGYLDADRNGQPL
ncbi:MAG TPA: hypothetical protein VIW29_22595 [Polyangiaceae bacterium]